MADIVNYLQQINNAADDIEQIAKALKILPKIEPYADNMLDSIIIIRANINCIQDIPHIYDKTVDVQRVKRGRWLNNHAIWIEQPEIEGYFVQAECSECGRWAHEMKPYTRFLEYEKCPHCGAVMSTKG